MISQVLGQRVQQTTSTLAIAVFAAFCTSGPAWYDRADSLLVDVSAWWAWP
jgi:hypothetical protein